MNIFDLIIFAPLAYGAYKGYKRGLIMSLFMLLAIIVGLYAAFQLTDTFVDFAQKQFNWEKSTLVPIVFIILFLVIGAGIYFAGKLLETALKVVKLSLFNNLAGLFLGVLQWIYLVGTLLLFVLSTDKEQQIIPNQTRNTSIAIPFYTGMLKNTLPKLGQTLIFESYLDQLKQKPTHDEQ